MRSSISWRICSVHGSAPKRPTCSEDAARVEALRGELVDDREHVGRRHHDDLRPEVGDQLDLPRRHPARDRDDRRAEPLDAVVRAEAAGEQAVAVGVVHLVAGPPAGRAEGAGHHLGPDVEVARGVADDRRLAGGAGRGVDAADPVLRDGEHAERVVLPQVGLARGGEASRGRRARGSRRGARRRRRRRAR